MRKKHTADSLGMYLILFKKGGPKHRRPLLLSPFGRGAYTLWAVENTRAGKKQAESHIAKSVRNGSVYELIYLTDRMWARVKMGVA